MILSYILSLLNPLLAYSSFYFQPLLNPNGLGATHHPSRPISVSSNYLTRPLYYTEEDHSAMLLHPMNASMPVSMQYQGHSVYDSDSTRRIEKEG